MAALDEIYLKEENIDNMELENIFKDIFFKCDKENDGRVKVSTLLKFIAPFIDSNEEHLCELKKILDPLDINPIISYDLFSNAMKTWTDKFNQKASLTSNDKPVTTKTLSDQLRQSTPTKESIEKGTNNNDFDCGLNISNISSYSYAGSVQSTCDPLVLNEQINELQHQNKKLTDLLSEVRSQLALSEEVNSSLQNDLDNLKRSRQTDQKLIEDLQKMRIDLEKEREENGIQIKNYNSINESLNFYKKENSQLKKQILDFETEIQKNQEILSSLRLQEDKQRAKIKNYEDEIQMKTINISSFEEKFKEIYTICSEKDSIIKNITEEIQNLRSDNNSLQKRLDDLAKKNTALKSDLINSGNKSSPSFKPRNPYTSTPHSPILHPKFFYSGAPYFNSPKMLKMLSTPISPIQNNSTCETFSDSSKSTVIEQQISSPINNVDPELSKDYVVHTYPQENKRSLSEADVLNFTSSSVDSETNPEKRASLSLGPEVVFDDECFQDQPVSCKSSPQSHESLQLELIRASKTECFGLHTVCEHKLQLIQCEEENENLKDQIRRYTDEIDKKNELNHINTKLQDQISLLIESQNSNNVAMEGKVEELQNDNEEMTAINVTLKSDITSIKMEKKRYLRLQQKFKKLQDTIYDEETKSERVIMQNNSLQSKIKEMSLTLEQSKLDLAQLLEKDNNLKRISAENTQLKSEINELSPKIKKLELIKSQLEDKLVQEKNCSNELQENIKFLEEKLSKEENNAKELKSKVNELTSYVQRLEKGDHNSKESIKEENERKQLKLILTELEEKLAEEENKTKILKININKLSSKIQELKEKLFKKKRDVKQLNIVINEQTSKIQKLEKTKCNLTEQQMKEENEAKELKLKLNDLSVKTEILEEMKYQLEEKLTKEKKTTKELQYKIMDMSSNLEILKQNEHYLEDQLTKEENKLKIVSAKLNEMTTKNRELEIQNNRLLVNIQNLEIKIQSFRKSKIDIENTLRVISIQRDSLMAHINFTKEQIKKCTDLLGKNTLLVSNIWLSDLELMISKEEVLSDLTDEASLSGIMRISDGQLIEDLKNLINQTRLTEILLKSLAKLKQNETLEEEDVLLSAVFSPETPAFVTQSTFSSNYQSFSIYLANLSTPSSSSTPLMSPESTQPEMTEEESHYISVDLTQPGLDVSSPTGSVFIPEASEDTNGVNIVNGHVAEEAGSDTEKKAQKPPLKQNRSMSEGTTGPPLLTQEGDITLFPNLLDNVLESLGLQNGEQSRERSTERMSEEELEAKFQTLALIFAIDARTLAQRRELQRRQRDLADDNFAAEVARLEHGIQRLAPLCVDAEITELFTALLTRLNIIVKAAQRISISTQVFGGVQQEYRVAAAVNMMLVHLRNVQQQRDTARRQLQLTKKMLQESTVSESTSAAVSAVTRRLSTATSGRVVTRRRASIANIPRPLDSPSASGPAGIAAAVKRSVRRISADAYSEPSTKPWDWDKSRPEWMALERPVPPVRLSRPSRIELNLDLSKIHEGSVESTANNNEESDSDNNAYDTPSAILPSPNLFIEHQPIVRQPETFREHAIEVLISLARLIVFCWNRWLINGTTRETKFFLMFVCFAFVSIMMLNMMIVAKFTRQGTIIQRIPWAWLTWDELWNILFF